MTTATVARQAPAEPTMLLPDLPALVVGRVAHRRVQPLGHSLDHRYYTWLVDLDHLPAHRWPLSLLSSFRPQDHLDGGRLGGGIRGDLVRFLQHRGVDVGSHDRFVMLAHGRSLGHGFNPLSVHWCIAPDGQLRAAVLEVHNTYGQRHAYLLRPDATGRAGVDKEFYVSPFNDVSGAYDVRLRLEPRRVSVSVRLERDGATVLTAGLSGRPQPATRRAIVRTAFTHPLMTQQVSALIRVHGIWLWLKRLPVRPRPDHDDEAAVR